MPVRPRWRAGFAIVIAGEQLEVRAAWLYYMEGLTQADIARRLGTTRLRINRILVDARRNGLVGITLNSELASCVELDAAHISNVEASAAFTAAVLDFLDR